MITPYSDSVKNGMQIHYHSLPERLRRQYAAIESQKIGWGGQTYISELFGLNPRSIRLGVRELTKDLPSTMQSRQRRVGGGRKKICQVG
jgi:hypothetical protein